ncbi:hypothetical protein EV196_102530 [Mariniflexile fucanivorans]|uniref:Outer membrane protein with beta-barrel domain n=1 Tax=Mariniflexile fucanivorans TaxID=264023 RepID=A0A4V2QEG6_9FLAO|nr:outer membrane beta-barrel protein [Mariniflexile fucanivorans]TCL67967.1 hypothetical protein EV196_102530 [Mariniflexile fucanivorans]
MKQKFLIVLLTLFFIKSYSQEGKVKIQLSTGTTLSIPKTSKLTDSNIDGNPQIKSSTNIGAFVLPSLNYSLNEKTSIDFGIGYYIDRFSIEEKVGNVTNDGNRNVSQIQTPINLNFHFGDNNCYLFGIGGFSSFLMSAKEKGESTISYNGFNTGAENPVLDPLVNTNLSQNYDNDIKDRFNSISFGAFIQLKKNISFSANTKGFLILKINQYFNSIKNNDSNSDLSNYVNFKNEKEPTTINLGIGIEL